MQDLPRIRTTIKSQLLVIERLQELSLRQIDDRSLSEQVFKQLNLASAILEHLTAAYANIAGCYNDGDRP